MAGVPAEDANGMREPIWVTRQLQGLQNPNRKGPPLRKIFEGGEENEQSFTQSAFADDGVSVGSCPGRVF
jgi:hypothetical protein